jgi:outer membrane protein assembly factor BamB
MVHTRRFAFLSTPLLTGAAHAARRAGLLAVPAAALLLGGCSGLSGGSMPNATSPKVARASIKLTDDVYAELGYRRAWTGFAEVGKRAGVDFFRADSDLVLVQDGASTITALDAATGARRWRSTLATPLSKFVGIVRHGNDIVVCGEGGTYIIDPATGKTVDRQPFKRVVSTPPLQIGSTLLFGTGVGRVFAHDLVSGLAQWENTVGGSVESAGIAVGGSVAFVSKTGNLSFLDPTSNSLRGLGGMYSGTNLPLAASDRLVFVASQDQSIYAFSPNSQLPIWQVRTEAPLANAPVYHAGVVYCTIAKKGMTALDARTGAVNWSAAEVSGAVIGTRAGRLLVWNGSVATVLDPADGSVYFQQELTGVDHLAVDAFTDGNLYAISDEGLVIRLVPAS